MARTLASNRSRAVARSDSLTTTPTRPRDERRDPDERLAAEAGHARALVDDRRLDDVRRDLDARHEIARLDDLAVEDGEHLERIDPVEPLEVGDPDVHARPGARRAGRPGSGPGRATVRPGPATAVGEPERGLVLVELAGLGDEDA